MGYEICEKLRELTPYEPVNGTFRVRLDANESFLPLPDEIQEKLGRIMETVRLNRYPDPMASELCRDFARFYGVDPDHVTAGERFG